MTLKVLFNKDAVDKRFHTGWGVSFLIEESLLFDTGEKGSWLIENMGFMKVDIDKIEKVIISHDHWDHTGGLWDLLKRKRLNVYSCFSFSQEFKRKVKNSGGILIENGKFTEVEKDIFTTGEIPAKYKDSYIHEQALVIKTDKGVSLLTGCAHPGIIKILKEVRKFFPEEKFYLVMGGFHLMEKEKREIEIIVGEFKKLGVKLVGPTHCSGYEAESIFKDRYKENFISVRVGEVIIL